MTILRSDQLSAAQKVAEAIRELPIVLTLLVLILYGLAIYLAGPRRRQALRSVGLGLVAAGAVALVLRSIAGTELVGSLVSNEAAKPAAEAVWGIATSLLVTVASAAIAFGVLVFLGARLAGPTSLATSIRRAASPYLRESPVAAGAFAAAVWIALIAWAPIAAFRKPLGILLFAVLFTLGGRLLGRQTRREFPDGEPLDIGGWLRGAWAGRTRRPGKDSAGEIEGLERLGALHRSGDLSDVEFAAAKARLLAGGAEAVS